jgi:pyruvate,water dikinase
VGAAIARLIALSHVTEEAGELVGGKAATLASLSRAGFPIADGFCITTAAYFDFIKSCDLDERIAIELARKSLSQMRWEEMWDSALRIRNAFLVAEFPTDLRAELSHALDVHGKDQRLAVRSSAIGEDGAQRSYAGIHESVTNVCGEEALLEAVKQVWSSLWSDAAILYTADLSLEPSESAMAVLVQTFVESEPSGVAFALDPSSPDTTRCLVESVPGRCADLVDGRVEPERWCLSRETHEVVSHTAGSHSQTHESSDSSPLLDEADLHRLVDWMAQIEELTGWPPDIEWTGRAEALTLLQARPITTRVDGSGDDRSAYLALRPSRERLSQLRSRIAHDLIPKIERAALDLANENLEHLSDVELSAELRKRAQEVSYWRKRYDEELIPLAHAVRQLGFYYNDALKPDDPFEFVALLRGEALIATARNDALAALATRLAGTPGLRESIVAFTRKASSAAKWSGLIESAQGDRTLAAFLESAETTAHEIMNVAYDDHRLDERPIDFLHVICELTAKTSTRDAETQKSDRAVEVDLEARFLRAFGPARKEEAVAVLDDARFAWKLRDDDNILLARIEGELLRAVDAAAQRLRTVDRLGSEPAGEADTETLAEALLDVHGRPVELKSGETWSAQDRVTDPLLPLSGRLGHKESARQLTGQPAAPGLATGTASCVRGAEDLGRFHAGDVLVCDAIQPMMTHLVPLAVAVIERRGGMLIHGAIIARELGLPCVNGVPGVVDMIDDGDLVTVDGYLGIVTIDRLQTEGC